ncbi:hypothetical protein WMF30_20230 [Sorangium sp. So ce134]
MTYIASLFGRAALAAAALTSGAALLASCAGTLDEDFKEEYAAGGDGSGAGDGQGATTASGAGGATSASTGGDAVTTGEGAATSSASTGDAAATSSASTGGNPACGDVPGLLVQTCSKANCHDGTSRASGLSLAAGFETMIKNQPSQSCGGSLLVPGQPDQSSIYTKLTEAPPCGLRMPLGIGALTDEQIACVADWITTLPP